MVFRFCNFASSNVECIKVTGKVLGSCSLINAWYSDSAGSDEFALYQGHTLRKGRWGGGFTDGAKENFPTAFNILEQFHK